MSVSVSRGAGFHLLGKGCPEGPMILHFWRNLRKMQNTAPDTFCFSQCKVTERVQTCPTTWKILPFFPPFTSLTFINKRRKMKRCAFWSFCSLTCISSYVLLFLTNIHMPFDFCFMFKVMNSVAYSRTKQRMRDVQISLYSEKKTQLCSWLPFHQKSWKFHSCTVLPLLLNEMAATAPPLGSISRPLCRQKEQQITFTWIVRFIIISRWQSLHYNAAEKRLTSLQIKIYNANTHLWLFVQA